VSPKQHATGEAAKAVGISRASLQEWIRAGKIRAPRTVLRDGRAVRLWTSADLEKVRKYKADHYCKGRGRKKGKKFKS